MGVRGEAFDKALTVAAERARAWLDGASDRHVAAQAGPDVMHAAFARPLPDEGTPADQVVELLASIGEPGLTAMQSGRFFGFVIGGTLPAALGADWLVSAWDQNTGLRQVTPTTAAVEEVAGDWLLDLLGLPSGADVGFVTGATMANFSCLAAARTAVLARAGWDVAGDGLHGAPRVHVLVGDEVHESVEMALRYLGLGRPTRVAADAQGRIRVDALTDALARVPDGEPVIVCLQAGDVHSGAFDPFRAAIDAAHARGAWVHVDGAFGLWAAAVPALAPLVDGMNAADSWATDAHKTLNVPYDCGVSIVTDTAALRTTMSAHGSYLIPDEGVVGDPLAKVPEFSRRARGVPVWAALMSLGRAGVTSLVAGLVDSARALADGIAAIDGAEVLNDVVYTQVCVAFGSDERTKAVVEKLLADGTVWMSGSRWQDRAVLRISVSNWSTDAEDVQRSIEAVRQAVAEL